MENLFFSAVSNKCHIFGVVFIRKSCLLEGGAYSNHVVIILNRYNNSKISIETLVPQQAGGFIIKHYFGISNIAA